MTQNLQHKNESVSKIVGDIESDYIEGLYLPLPVIANNKEKHCVECDHFKTDCPNCPTCARQFASFFAADCDCPDPDKGPESRSTAMFYGCGVACPIGKYPRMRLKDYPGE